MSAWEKIVKADNNPSKAEPGTNPYNVWRLEVPGGWIYATDNCGVAGFTYVPRPKGGE
jgi:hypothetical protein